MRLLNPAATFLYNYVFRLGFLDGRAGLLQHINHSFYIHWKYAKAFEAARKSPRRVLTVKSSCPILKIGARRRCLRWDRKRTHSLAPVIP